jgi:hypothetical protein
VSLTVHGPRGWLVGHQEQSALRDIVITNDLKLVTRFYFFFSSYFHNMINPEVSDPFDLT